MTYPGKLAALELHDDEKWPTSHDKNEYKSSLDLTERVSYVPRSLLTIEQTLTLLAETPQHIETLTSGLTPVQLREIPEDDEWSATDVLAHLRSCADVWGGCIVTILEEDHPTIRAVNPRTWIRQTDYHELEFRPSFESFARQRAELLDVLEPLLPEAWLRGATVMGAGRPLERTIQSHASWLARHERPHFRQIRNTANALQA